MSFEGRCFISGVLSKMREITAFLNCTTNSYKRFGIGYAPKYVNWSSENCAQLIRVPKPVGISPRIEIRSADACCNPYITFKLILAAGVEGIISNDCSLFESAMHSGSDNSVLQPLPSTLEEAAAIAKESAFVKSALSAEILSNVFNQLDKQIADYAKAADKDKFEEESYFKFV